MSCRSRLCCQARHQTTKYSLDHSLADQLVTRAHIQSRPHPSWHTRHSRHKYRLEECNSTSQAGLSKQFVACVEKRRCQRRNRRRDCANECDSARASAPQASSRLTRPLSPANFVFVTKSVVPVPVTS